MTIGEKIRAVRIEKGFSQRRLQEESGVERNFLSLVENNHRSPSFKTLMRIATALDVSVGYITDYEKFFQDTENCSTNFLNSLKKAINEDGSITNVQSPPIPIFNNADLVNAANTEINGFFFLPSQLIAPSSGERYRCFWIKDEERGFPPIIGAGALICLDLALRNPRELENEIVAFNDNDKGCIVRRLSINDGYILGMPEKPFVQKPLVIPAGEKNLILGKVVWSWNKFF